MGVSVMATMNDVARLAGVSQKTVSRVINHETWVSDQTRQRVLKAVEKLDYRPDLSARSLRSARAYVISLIYDNPNPYYIQAMQEGTLSVCDELGFDLHIHPCKAQAMDLARDLVRRYRRSRLSGMILTPPISENAHVLHQLNEAGANVVRILSASPDLSDEGTCVYVDDHHASYAITEHLIRLGHARIGFLWGDADHRSSQARYRGYVDALHAYSIKRDEALILQGDFSFDDGFRRARQLFALASRPTAIFGANDEIAAGALVAARSSGIDVPHDLSIAGFEDNPFARQTWPALTTARQATEKIARHAAQLLIEQTREKTCRSTSTKLFRPELIVRGSTSPPRHRQAGSPD